MSPIESTHIKTWQFYSTLKRIMTKEWLVNFFSVKSRQIDRWSCDPNCCESSRRNPMDRYEALLEKLMEMGRVDVARGAVDRQARIVECELVCPKVKPDKTTMSDELLDDLPAVAALHRAIQDQEPEMVVRERLRFAKQELDEDYSFYLRNR